MLKRTRRNGALAEGILTPMGRVIVRHPILVIVGWLATAAVLFLLIPPLAVVAQKNPPDFLPAESPVLVAGNQMQEAFQEANASNAMVVILVDDAGLSPADEQTYRALVERLKTVPDVSSTQDFIAIPELREVMVSEDGKAYNLPVTLTGVMGTPAGQEAYRNAVEVVESVTEGTTLKAYFVGGPATLEDVNSIGARDQIVIEIATVGTILTILILVYRSLIGMLIPMVTIGVSLAVANQVVAGLGELGLGLGPQTIVLMTAMMMGAGVDYAVFLFSRYQELVRGGMPSDDALVGALGTIGKVIAGSAATVAITFLGLGFTTLAVFSTVGPALAVTITIGFLASVTLLPALIVLAGRRGWVNPRKDRTGRFWRRSGVNIVRKPVRHLVASLSVLAVLGVGTIFLEYNYDDRKALPDDATSNIGYDAMDDHFPVSTTLQQFVVIRSEQDLRTPRALADMEQMAARIAAVPNIDMVRGITRPTGEMLEQAKATWQAGEVGTRLEEAGTLIDENDENLDRLSGGAHQLADVLDELRTGVVNAAGSVRGLASALDDMSRKYGGEKTLDEIDRTATLVTNMRDLGNAIGVDVDRITDIYAWGAPVLRSLDRSPECATDPECVESREDLRRIVATRDSPVLNSISELGRELQNTEGFQSLDETIKGLSTSLKTATEAARELGMGQPGGVTTRLNEALLGANTLADSSRQLAEGVQLLVDQTRTMGGGLDQASAFLLAMKRDASNPPMSGFYIPPEILTQAEFKKAASLFVSPDGHTARYLVQTALDPFGTEAMDQVAEIVDAAESALPNTSLAGSEVSMVGFSAVQNDLRNYYDKDVQFIVVVTLIVVFVILVLLLRALVAPLYLVASVVISYVSAVGIGVAFFGIFFDQKLYWTVPGMAFLVLVAVGADYNLLLIHRIREESRNGIRTGIVKTVGATGGVITSAGLIFAASMLSLTVSSIATVIQLGFVIGIGLLLDTFIVRTITVPAVAALVGKANWWPSTPKYEDHDPPASTSADHGPDHGDHADDDEPATVALPSTPRARVRQRLSEATESYRALRGDVRT
ncbi:RND family transporter [Mycolicibacterium sp. F2034L]|uniref:MMPL/RND family transporter n=1 Tax=Mycolicibacterium sp. F2034L TaxID=2926422 RepID=UPI001FF6750B|nr:RND family transporter [Mycolicibacterium sp. F2034L]MCK0175174.1 RND family transporter [Mycolicibacterium sp. F2034L]